MIIFPVVPDADRDAKLKAQQDKLRERATAVKNKADADLVEMGKLETKAKKNAIEIRVMIAQVTDNIN